MTSTRLLRNVVKKGLVTSQSTDVAMDCDGLNFKINLVCSDLDSSKTSAVAEQEILS